MKKNYKPSIFILVLFLVLCIAVLMITACSGGKKTEEPQELETIEEYSITIDENGAVDGF